MSTVCSICTTHSPDSGQTGRTSTDMLCHDASNSLCPSNKLEIPAFPLQGRSFKKGVRFSVQTTSPGSVPWRRCSWSEGEWSPAGSKDTIGCVVRVESIKFKDAQKRPDNDWVKVIHFANALSGRQSAHQLAFGKHISYPGRVRTHHYLEHQSTPTIPHRYYPL